MDELEFQKRVYANPEEVDQEVLDAARDNPAYQKILDQARELNAAVTSLVNNISVPSGLADKLGAIPADDEAATKIASKPAANSNFFQYYAIAASLILASGVTFLISDHNEPQVSDLAVGVDILRHLYYEAAEIESMQSVIALSTVTAVMASAGSQLVANELLQGLSVVMAKPCVILAAYQSTHLVLEGAQGAVNVIVINNSPVAVEFSFRDDRFEGMVIPLGDGGNLVLVGEKNENLDLYKDLFSENVEWVI